MTRYFFVNGQMLKELECQPDTCLNGGICSVTGGELECLCQNGFTGARCDVIDDKCLNVSCPENAICVEGINSHRCICQPGFSGRIRLVPSIAISLPPPPTFDGLKDRPASSSPPLLFRSVESRSSSKTGWIAGSPPPQLNKLLLRLSRCSNTTTKRMWQDHLMM